MYILVWLTINSFWSSVPRLVKINYAFELKRSLRAENPAFVTLVSTLEFILIYLLVVYLRLRKREVLERNKILISIGEISRGR